MIISSKSYKVEFFEEPEYVTNHSEQIENIVKKFLAFFDVSILKVDVSFCTENEIKKLNKEFRGKIVQQMFYLFQMKNKTIYQINVLEN